MYGMVKGVVGRNARTGGAVGKCAAELREEDGFVLPEGSLILTFPRCQWGGGAFEEVQKNFSVLRREKSFSQLPLFSSRSYRISALAGPLACRLRQSGQVRNEAATPE